MPVRDQYMCTAITCAIAERTSMKMRGTCSTCHHEKSRSYPPNCATCLTAPTHICWSTCADRLERSERDAALVLERLAGGSGKTEIQRRRLAPRQRKLAQRNVDVLQRFLERAGRQLIRKIHAPAGKLELTERDLKGFGRCGLRRRLGSWSHWFAKSLVWKA